LGLASPLGDLGVLVHGEVVQHAMHIKVLGDLTVDLLQKGQEVLMSVMRHGLAPAFAEHHAGGAIERGEQVGGAVALVGRPRG
jgi:hypothetical protein